MKVRYERFDDLTAFLEEAIASYDAARQDWIKAGVADQTLNFSEIVGPPDEEMEAMYDRHPELLQPLPLQIFAELVDQFAENTVRAAQGLSVDDESTRLGAKYAPAFRELDQIILDKIQLRLWKELDINPRRASERCIQLAETVRLASPSSSTRKYLRRLARCYLAGFDAECIMLCRAILENAVTSRFDLEKILLPQSMNERLLEAERHGWISTADRDNGRTVWHRGNKAVHSDPHLIQDVFGTIRLTLAFVQVIAVNPQ